MSLDTSEPQATVRRAVEVPPAWAGTSLVLAALAVLPTAVAIGRWGWTPTTGPLVFVVLAAVVIVEAWASASHRAALTDEERRRHRVVEALALGLLTAGAAWVGRPLEALRPDRLLGPDLVVAALVTFGVWVLVSQTHRDLAGLVARGRVDTGQNDPLERLLRRALLVALIAALAVSLARVPFGVAAVALYAAGVAGAIARVRFADLERRWTAERTRVGPEVRGRVRALAGGLIVGVTALALLLPSPVGPGARATAAILRAVTGWLERRFTWLFEDLLGMEEREVPDQEVTDATEWLEEAWGTPEPVGAPFDLPDPLTWTDPYWAAFAWVGGALVVTTIVVLYLRERPHLVRALGLHALAGWLRHPRRLARTLTGFVSGVLEAVVSLCRWAAVGLQRARRRARGAQSEDDLARGGTTDVGGRGPDAPAAVTARERARVLGAYRGVVDAAAARGRGRSVEQTPYEYERRLAPTLPQHDAELHRLTEVFVIARYSTVEIEADAAEEALAAAHILREVLAGTGEDPR